MQEALISSGSGKTVQKWPMGDMLIQLNWVRVQTAHKVSRPNYVTYLNWTAIYEWFVVEEQERNLDMWFESLNYVLKNLLTTLGSIVNIIEGQPGCFIYGSSTFDFDKS